MKLKKGDLVKVLCGKDRGREGHIVALIKKDNKVVVEKINLIKKHEKKSKDRKDPGGIIEVEAPIDASNVMAIESKSGKTSRIGYKQVKGKKVRYFKKNNAIID